MLGLSRSEFTSTPNPPTNFTVPTSSVPISHLSTTSRLVTAFLDLFGLSGLVGLVGLVGYFNQFGRLNSINQMRLDKDQTAHFIVTIVLELGLDRHLPIRAVEQHPYTVS